MTSDPAPSPEESDGGAGVSLNRKALYSVVFGSTAFAAALFVWFLGFALAVPAVTCGVHGLREIKDARGTEGGDMVAVIGLTIGATTLGLLFFSSIVTPLLN